MTPDVELDARIAVAGKRLEDSLACDPRWRADYVAVASARAVLELARSLGELAIALEGER